MEHSGAFKVPKLFSKNQLQMKHLETLDGSRKYRIDNSHIELYNSNLISESLFSSA